MSGEERGREGDEDQGSVVEKPSILHAFFQKERMEQGTRVEE